MTDHLAPPHGGTLVDLLATPERAASLRQSAASGPSWDLTPRQICDLELLLTGAFSPLRGFQTRADCDRVCRDLRLGTGELWPIPITLDVTPQVADPLRPGDQLALRDPEGTILAVLDVADVWRPDWEAQAQAVFGTTDPAHPGVAHLRQRGDRMCVGGPVTGLQPPVHHDFTALRHTPARLRARLHELGFRRVVAFQTRNPLHRAHFELTRQAARAHDAGLLLHPAVGVTRPGDLDHYVRVRCYQALLPRYPAGSTELSLLPLAMRMAGPREALLHAIVRKNHGCTHFIVGRDHAGPGNDASGRPFYPPYAAQELLRQHADELGIAMVPFRELVYVPDQDRYRPAEELPPGTRTLTLSGSELRARLAAGDDLPEWFTFPEVAEELRRSHPPRGRQGFAVFFTGLPASGKSTIAAVLAAQLMELGGRAVTVLDGDLVRKNLSAGLGFSRADRERNVLRIGFVAAAIARSGGIAICAQIAPHAGVRTEVRAMMPPGNFVLVHVDTPLAVCERRDPKGLYAQARAGLLPQFTGVSDPYEAPTDAEVTIDTAATTAQAAAAAILDHLERAGLVDAVSRRRLRVVGPTAEDQRRIAP